MRVILISIAILFTCSPMLAQQSQQEIPVPRTFIPDEPQPCREFDRMASRLDAVYKTEEISKEEYDQGIRRNGDGAQAESGGYFVVDKNKYRRVSLLPDKRAEFIRWYAVEGGRGQMSVATAQCNIELQEREGIYNRIYAIRQLQDTMTVSEAEKLLSDVALEGQNIAIKALLESEADHLYLVDRYNKLVQNVTAYHEAVKGFVASVNSMLQDREPPGPELTLNFKFVPPEPLTCTGSALPFTNSAAYLANASAMANSTIHCQ